MMTRTFSLLIIFQRDSDKAVRSQIDAPTRHIKGLLDSSTSDRESLLEVEVVTVYCVSSNEERSPLSLQNPTDFI